MFVLYLLFTCSTVQMLNCSIFCLRQKIPPRGGEHNSANNDSKITYNSTPVKRWPESGTDSAKTPKISPELQQVTDSKNEQSVTDSTHNHNNSLHQKCAICVHQNQTDSSFVEIVAVWPELPEHIKAAIKALVSSYLRDTD